MCEEKGKLLLVNNNETIQGGLEKHELDKPLYRYFYTYKYFEDAIVNQRLYLYNTTACNDPYDSTLQSPLTYEEMKESFKGLKINYKPIIESKHTVLCCLSEVNNSIFMWAHYGNEQRGMCIEYDFTEKPDLIKNLIKVRYDDKYNPDNYYTSVLKKSNQWAYELEWRIVGSYIDADINNYLSLIDKRRYIDVSGCIKSVIIGNKTPKKKVKKIVRLCKERGITIKKIDYSRSNYEYIIVDNITI